MNRRKFLNVAALGAAANFARADGIGMRDPLRKFEAVAFDGFAIFDPRPIGGVAENVFPGRGADLMAVWRTRQFEYCWLRTLTGSYVDFWQVTRDALAFACASLGVELKAADGDRLMETYLSLKPWPDVMASLRQLHAAKVRLAFLTNFTAGMLNANIRSAGLEEFFEARLSTDQVSAFKPDPRSYQMAVDHFRLPREAIAFVAFGGWDAAGAKRFGYPVYWCNRLGQPAEELGASADSVANNLELLPAFVAAR
jgi:2-haloacid dehalogenase